MDKLVDWIKTEEGFRAFPYRCSQGFLTIGYGLNLDAGIHKDEAKLLLDYRIGLIQTELVKWLPWITTLDEVRQAVLISMAYQLGVPGLLKFNATLKAVKVGDYELASKRMLQSLWAKQTPLRAKRTAEAMANGQWPKGV